jgi:hypothetical protein
MGSKRVGLARIEAMIEALKRDLDLTSTTISGSPVLTTGNLTATGQTRLYSGQVVPLWTSKTLAASGALSANKWYFVQTATALTMTLPAAAASTRGDVIFVEYVNVINDGVTHKYGTSGEMFGAQSSVVRPDGSTGSAVGLIYTIDMADGTNDDFLNLIGLTNGGPGVGSHLTFAFNGTVWIVHAVLTSTGTAAAANASVFAAT